MQASPESAQAPCKSRSLWSISPKTRSLHQRIANDQKPRIHDLRRATFFKACSSTFIQTIIDSFRAQTFLPGENVTTEGESAKSLILLFHGKVAVVNGSEGTEVATLGSGAIFGEDALLGSPRCTSTVRATELCDCRLLDIDVFTRVLHNFPEEQLLLEQMSDDAKEAKERETARRIAEFQTIFGTGHIRKSRMKLPALITKGIQHHRGTEKSSSIRDRFVAFISETRRILSPRRVSSQSEDRCGMREEIESLGKLDERTTFVAQCLNTQQSAVAISRITSTKPPCRKPIIPEGPPTGISRHTHPRIVSSSTLPSIPDLEDEIDLESKSSEESDTLAQTDQVDNYQVQEVAEDAEYLQRDSSKSSADTQRKTIASVSTCASFDDPREQQSKFSCGMRKEFDSCFPGIGA